jgi:hypothetical protein
VPAGVAAAASPRCPAPPQVCRGQRGDQKRPRALAPHVSGPRGGQFGRRSVMSHTTRVSAVPGLPEYVRPVEALCVVPWRRRSQQRARAAAR